MTAETKQSRFQKLGGIIFSWPVITGAWGLNLAALLATVIWVCLDGEFTRVATWSFQGLNWWKVPLFSQSAPGVYESRVNALAALSIVAVGSFLLLVTSLFVGRGMQRSLKAWLALISLSAVWLTLDSAWPELAWRAQIWRVRGAVPAAELIAGDLLAHWPDDDNTLPDLGPFMAYPIGQPRSLMFIKKPTLGDSGIQFSQVEKSGKADAFDIHFQLAGNESGAWLTRTADGLEPKFFFSGLESTHFPQRFASLDGGWWLVVYSQGSIIDSPGDDAVPMR